MASANTKPIVSKVAKINFTGGGAELKTANTAKDGTGTVITVFTADATNGSRVEKVVFQPIGSNVATAARIFINNGSATSTPANNTYYKDVTLPATTLSEVATMPAVEVPLDLPLPPGYKLTVTVGTTVAAGYHVTAVGGDY